MPRFIDILLLLVILPFFIPLFLCVTLLAFIFHKNKIFFIQDRLGKNKKVFQLIKFRSMIENAQRMGTGLYSYSDDNRITTFGKFIRTTSLDELPQIINIIQGDMSFVGPRPAVVGELELECGLPENTDLRFAIKPGLSGWAQVHGRDDLTWREKIYFDLEFVNSKGLDRFKKIVFILFYTPLYIFNFKVTHEKRK